MNQKTKKSTRGGKRPGAGRPKGAKDKRKVMLEAAVARQVASDPTADSKVYLENILKAPIPDDADPMLVAAIEARKLEAAKVLINFQHPRLSSLEAKVESNTFVQTVKERAMKKRLDKK